MLFGYWACNITLLPRHNHPLQPRLRTIAARPVVEDGDAKATPPIASLTPQPELQIEELDNATKLRLEKAAMLRQLRLAKEAEDAAEKQAAEDIRAADKNAFRKARPST